MTESMTGQQTLDPELEEFAGQIADQIESFLVALQAIVRDEDGGRAISLLLLEVSQVLLAGARLGAQSDFTPEHIDRVLHARGVPRATPGERWRTKGWRQVRRQRYRRAQSARAR